MTHSRLIEQAREYCSGAIRKQGEALVAGLADAVERLQAERDAARASYDRTDREVGHLRNRLDIARTRAAKAEERLWALLGSGEGDQT